MAMLTSHCSSIFLLASALVACGGTTSPLSGVVFESSRKLDGTDAVNIGGTHNIWRVNFDGTRLAPLTRVTGVNAVRADCYRPQLSPDRSEVVFYSARNLDGSNAVSNSTTNIWRVSSDGTGLMPLTKTTAVEASSSFPHWSPDGSKVVFHSSRKLDRSDAPQKAPDGLSIVTNIWRVNADGSGLAPLTTSTDGPGNYSPHWSPDGSRVVFDSSRKLDGSEAAGRANNLWLVNADGTGLTPLTTASAGVNSLYPQWSPDGSKVVFESTRRLDGSDAVNVNFTRNIWLVNADSTGLTPLTTATAAGADSFLPHWSPDGSKVVFDSARRLDGSDAVGVNRVFNVWQVNADGTGLTPLTIGNAAGSGLAHWSPDGSSIVFTSSRKLDGSDAPNSAGNIWRMNSDGTEPTPLTTVTAIEVTSTLGADSEP